MRSTGKAFWRDGRIFLQSVHIESEAYMDLRTDKEKAEIENSWNEWRAKKRIEYGDDFGKIPMIINGVRTMV